MAVRPSGGPGSGPRKATLYKWILLGNFGVGKTCFAHRVHKGSFLATPLTSFSANSAVVKVPMSSGAIMPVELWDTAGQERFRSLTLTYFRNAMAVLLLYDASYKATVDEWLQEILVYFGGSKAETPPVFLIGTKLDEAGEAVRFTETEVQRLSDTHARVNIAGHFALSSKTGQNVQETLVSIADLITAAEESRPRPPSPKHGESVRVGEAGSETPSKSIWSRC